MEKNIFLTRDKVNQAAKFAIGKKFKEFSKEIQKGNKGVLGQLLETSVFKFANNSKSAPDFEEAGIELKLTPYKINQNGTLSAKERLVLNIINYMEEYKYNFENSHFMFKNRNIQLLWYLYENDKNKEDFKLTNELLISLDDSEFINDKKIIEADWKFIIAKIKAGEAHLLSESDTMYLGACPKGKDKNLLREQPFSDKKAMQRAFCYKTSYMSSLVRKYIGNCDNELIIKEKNNKLSFENYLISKIKKYYGKSEKDLLNEFNINKSAKNRYQMIISKILNLTNDIQNTDEFLKANIKVKTIRIEENSSIRENMSFSAFKFEDIIKQNWESSDLYNFFETTKFMFVLFKKYNNEYRLYGIKFWNMPYNILNNEIKKVWLKTKEIIKSGNIIKKIENGVIYNNFPKQTDNAFCHVRPHAKNSKDTFPLPIPDKLTKKTQFTKQCFWLNNEYIKRLIGEIT